MGRHIAERVLTLRGRDAPAVVIDGREPACVQSEGTPFGVWGQDIFAGGLNINAARLRDFGQRTTQRNSRIGMRS